MTTHLTAAEVAEPFSLTQIASQIGSFIDGVLRLDPQEAALRSGVTLLIILGALLILWLVRIVVHALLKKWAPPDETPRARRHIGGLSFAIVRIGIGVAALLLALQVWGIAISAILSGPFGAALIAAGRIALTVVVMLIAIEFVQAIISRGFERIAQDADAPRRAAQLRTLGPLVSGVATIALFIIATMMVLSSIGIEIGPLIAGAGIIGVAVGFGAQTLVKDFLTGIFHILEDTVSVGDVVKIGDASGLVEDMSLRTIKLRAFDGTLQVIPFSEAQIINNMTKGFSFYVLDLSIAYSSDIMKALELMKSTGDDLRATTDFGPMILEPIEIFGVDQLADSGVMLKARIKTRPIMQWNVGREYLKRIKLAFDANGIEIPFPHLKLVAPDAPIPVDEDARSSAA